ncbi:MAG: ABC transporter permease [Gammaproteobacteria bacterium]
MYNLAYAYFKRDGIIELSYKFSFFVQMLGNVVLLVIFYYIGQMTLGKEIPALTRYGGSYLAFLLIGLALTECVSVSLTTFAKQIREGQLTGALEITLLSPVSLTRLLLYSALWPYFISAIRFFVYLIIGMYFYHVGFDKADVGSALVIFALVVIAFAGLGMCWASVVLLIKRGEAILTVMSYLFVVLSGVLFPQSLLPKWLQQLAQWIPLTHGLEGMRLALLQGVSLSEQLDRLLILSLFSVVLILMGIAAFHVAVRIAKEEGSLAQY